MLLLVLLLLLLVVVVVVVLLLQCIVTVRIAIWCYSVVGCIDDKLGTGNLDGLQMKGVPTGM